jgi:hypothetical protein
MLRDEKDGRRRIHNYATFDEYCDSLANQLRNMLKDAPAVCKIEIQIVPGEVHIEQFSLPFVQGKFADYFEAGEYGEKSNY